MWYSILGGIVTLTLGLLIAPLAVDAQPPGKIYHIGFLSALFPPVAPDWQQRSPFLQGLRELGWIEGQNMVIERRWAERQFERLPALATELVQLKVDLIVAEASLEIAAAKQATTTIPVVMLTPFDAVETGLVASLAHPGANVTGMTSMTLDFDPKRLELLKETVPGSSRIAVLWCKAGPGSDFLVRAGGPIWEEMQVTARALGVQLQRLEAGQPDDYEGAFTAAISERAAAMVVGQCYSNVFNQQRIVDLAAQHRLPAIYSGRPWVRAGGLMSYGPRWRDVERRAATYVDKILKGAKPANLPVEQPTKFELIINLKAAKQIGLTIPPNVLARADKVIK